MKPMTRYCIQIFLVGLTVVLSRAENNVIKSNAKETNVFNFVRLVVLRLVYGFATMFGFKENISEIADGALVPPGADDYSLEDYDRNYAELDYR